MNAQIGDCVGFSLASRVRLGRVVGAEIVGRGDMQQREAGRWVFVSLGNGPAVELPESAVRVIVSELAGQ
jgi:hypothetical protein